MRGWRRGGSAQQRDARQRNRRQKMPQISPTEFCALPLRVHTLLADVPLHDVWAVDLPRHTEGVALSEFLHRASQDGCDAADAEISRFPRAARALFRIRFSLGRIFRLDAEPKDALAVSFGRCLTAEDRARSLAVSGTPEGLFRVVYRFENEQLLEIHNRTVHAAALSALVERADSYRFYFAVYVRQRTWITPLYMGLIDPFRKWIIYPALLKTIRATWDQKFRRKEVRSKERADPAARRRWGAEACKAQKYSDEFREGS